jgi:hypothetical protein
LTFPAGVESDLCVVGVVSSPAEVVADMVSEAEAAGRSLLITSPFRGKRIRSYPAAQNQEPAAWRQRRH